MTVHRPTWNITQHKTYISTINVVIKIETKLKYLYNLKSASEKTGCSSSIKLEITVSKSYDINTLIQGLIQMLSGVAKIDKNYRAYVNMKDTYENQSIYLQDIILIYSKTCKRTLFCAVYIFC